MTTAEKILSVPSTLTLNTKYDGTQLDTAACIAEFKLDSMNPLYIRDIDYNDEHPSARCFAISYESAVALATFLKTLFLDEAPDT